MTDYIIFENLLKKPTINLLNIDLLNSSSSSSQNSDSESEDTDESTTGTDSDEEEIDNKCKKTKKMPFVSNEVANYSDREYKKYFRLSRDTTNIIEDLINFAYKCEIQHGREMIPCNAAVLIFLWYIGNQGTFSSLADKFNVTKSSAYRVVNKVVEILFSKRHEFIKWPEVNEYEHISNEFKEKNGLHGVIGAIGGLHIPIKRPQQDSHFYVNSNGWHSISLQGTVDYRNIFIDAHCGEPGSLDDAEVLKKSSLYTTASNYVNFFKKYFLLGNSVYPSLRWLVPPFTNNGQLSKNQIQFNCLHSSTRDVVETAFNSLKGRFKRLRKFDNNKIDFIANCTIAICMLHNICILHNDLLDDDMNDPNDTEEDIEIETEDLQETARDLLFKSLF